MLVLNTGNETKYFRRQCEGGAHSTAPRTPFSPLHLQKLRSRGPRERFRGFPTRGHIWAAQGHSELGLAWPGPGLSPRSGPSPYGEGLYEDKKPPIVSQETKAQGQEAPGGRCHNSTPPPSPCRGIGSLEFHCVLCSRPTRGQVAQPRANRRRVWAGTLLCAGLLVT